MAQEGLTGFRRYKTPYVERINAQKGYLPALYAQKKQDAYNEQAFNLQQQGLDQNAEFAQQNIDLQKDALHEAKKRDRLAQQLGYAGLGLNAGFGVMNNFDTLSGIYNDITSSFAEPVKLGGGIPAFESLASAVTPSIKDLNPFNWSDVVGDSIYGDLVGDAIDLGDFAIDLVVGY